MTEAEFNRCTDPKAMLEFLRAGGLSSNRKLRLFGAACCRRLPDLQGPFRDLIDTAERLADGQVALAHLVAERNRLLGSDYAVWAATHEDAWIAAAGGAKDTALHAAQGVYEMLREGATLEEKVQAWDQKCVTEQTEQAALLRDLFGPLPFRRIRIEASWRTPTVLALATAIYEDRRFDDMPVLADALEEAGCDNAEILGHLRHQGQVHVRGCWALDLVLAKE